MDFSRRTASAVAGIAAAVLGLWGLGVVGAQGQAERKAPEALLPADALLYVRWDGFEAHRDAWEQTAAYRALTETHLGEFLADSLEMLVMAAAESGGEPSESAGRQLMESLRYVGRHGATLAVTVRNVEPFDGEVTVVVPGAGAAEARESFVEMLQLTFAGPMWQYDSLTRAGRRITQATSEEEELKAAWWSEGSDLLVTFGSEGADAVLDVIEGERPNLTTNPLLDRFARGDGFEQVAVAWADGKRLRDLFGNLPAADAAEMNEVLAALGLDGLDALAIEEGLVGKRLETVITVQAPSPRRGLLKLLDQKPFTFDELPPLPADGGFYAFSFDTAALYDEALAMLERVSEATQPGNRAMIDATVAQLQAMLGFDLRDDLLAHLGHVTAIYSEGGGLGMGTMMLPLMGGVMWAAAAEGPGGPGMPGPAEMGIVASMFAMGGFGGFNAAVALEVTDAAALKETLEKLDQTLAALSQGRLTVTTRERAATTMKLYRLDQQGMFLTPAVALTDRWLIVGTFPQPVEAFLLRSSGELPVWQPSADVREALAGLPREMTWFTVSDPRPALETLLGLAPLGASIADSSVAGVDLDVSQIPPVEQVTAHLFENVTICTVDDESVRWISRSSLPSIPILEGGGVATTGVMAALLLPAVQAARSAARRTQSASNMRQQAIALHIHHDAEIRLPAGTHPNPDLPPQQRFSWIVDLLPYIEERPLYDQLDLAKSWNDPANRDAASALIGVFINPSLGDQRVGGYGATHYVGVAGLGEDAATLPAKDPRAGVFGYDRRVRMADVPDGTSNTIAIMEVSENIGPWSAGGNATVRGFSERPYLRGPDGFGGATPGGANAAFLDGHVKFISDDIDPEIFEALVTTSGGEIVPSF